VRKEGGYEVIEAATATVAEHVPSRRRKEREEPVAASSRKTLRIYPYGVSKDRLMRAVNDLQVSATIAKTPKDADIVLTLKAHEKRQPRTVKELEEHGLEVAIGATRSAR
jgi:hypothetical protein